MKFVFPLPHLVRLKATVQPWEAGVTGADQTFLAKKAEQLGYDMIAVPEHFIIPDEHLELSGPHYFHAAAAQGYPLPWPDQYETLNRYNPRFEWGY